VEKIRVMVVDDHEMVRLGLCSYLETADDLEVVGQADCGSKAVEMARELKPDVILMDLIMEGGTGIEATEQIKTELPATQIIILTSYVDEKLVFPALEAGALSYILKTSQAEEIAEAIRRAVRQESVHRTKSGSEDVDPHQR